MGKRQRDQVAKSSRPMPGPTIPSKSGMKAKSTGVNYRPNTKAGESTSKKKAGQQHREGMLLRSERAKPRDCLAVIGSSVRSSMDSGPPPSTDS